MEKIDISHKTIVFTTFFLLGLFFIYLIRDVILLLFMSIIFMFALSPMINKLEQRKIPRQAAILLIYLFFFGSLIGLIVSLVPTVIRQTTLLVENLPKYINGFSILNLEFRPSDFSQELAQLPMNIFKLITAAFSNLVNVLVFAVITFYLLMERKKLKTYLHFLFQGGNREERAEEFIERVETQIGGWVRGELFLMFIIGLLSYVGLRILDLDYALPLAVIAGILEIVTNIGPTIATIPAAVVGFSVSPVMGVSVIILYILIQQLENNLIVPKVMQKAAGLNPLVTITAIMVGLKIGGIIGAILALPVFLMGKVIIKEIYDLRMHSK